MNTTVNGSSCSFLPNPTAEKIGRTFAYCLILVVSLVGNSFIGIIVYKTQTLRKPINYFIVNMAMSDLLFPIFLLPVWIEELYMGTEWRISGPLGQALCKLVFFLPNVSMFVIYSESGPYSSGPIWSCGIPSPFSTHQFQAVPLLHSRHVDRRDGRRLAIFRRPQTG